MLGVLVDVVERLARQELGGEVGDGALTRSVAVLHRVETMVAARALQDLPVTGDQETDLAAAVELDGLVASKGASQDRRQLGRTVEEWADRRDGDRLAERERRAFLRRHLWAGRGSTGEPLIEGRLTPLVLAKLGAVLDPLSRRAGEDDDRTFGQRRHDALETVLDRAAAVRDRHPEPEPEPDQHGGPDRRDGAVPVGGAVGSSGGGRAQVLLVTTPDALHGLAGAVGSELDGFGPVSSETARQICCDADVATVTVGPDGAPLDVSPTRRFPTRRQRLAVIARDRRCVGCGAAASSCQVHHVRWRSDGGPTVVANLCLLCPSCHTNVHHFGWTVHRVGAGFEARPPPDRLRDVA